MIYYGIELAEGTSIVNLTVEGGPTLPTGLTSESQGRLYYNTTAETIDLWNGTAWITIAATNNGIVNSFNGRTGAITLLSSDLVGLLGPTNLPVASSSTLGAIKVGSSLVIDSSGVLNLGGIAEIVGGTVMLFGQAAAPTGWTQITSDLANNRMLRVVNGAGGGVGGSPDPTVMNVVPYHTHVLTGTTDVQGAHSHTYVYRGGQQPQSGNATECWWSTATQSTSVDGAHSHNLSGGTDGGSSSTNWSPRYVNLIACSKD